MSGIIIRGCCIVTMDKERQKIQSGDIHIENGRLVHVGKSLDLVPEHTEVIDGRDKVAIPGFVNTHHHLFESMLRGMSPNSTVIEWLGESVFPSSPHFQPEDMYWAVRLSLAECVESGVTTTIDWAFNLHSVEHAVATLQAIRDSRVRLHFAYGPSTAQGWGDFDIRLKDFEEVRSHYFSENNDSDRVRLWMGLGGPELQQDEGPFREELAVAREYGLPLHIHVRENEAAEPKNCVEVLESLGVLGPNLLMAHAIHLRDSDLDRVAKSGTKISYNALSNMRLASGICRVVELRERGVDISLGLDGSSTNDNNDFFALMRAAVGLQRVRWLRGDCVTVDDALEMATIGGARCLGQEEEIGSLEVGKRADVVLIDPKTINFVPLNDFVAQVVFCGQPRNVDTVIVEGEILKRDGELVGVDLGELLGKCQATAGKILNKAGLA